MFDIFKKDKSDHKKDDNLYINIDQAELLMPRREQIISERHRRGDTIRAVVKSVEVTPRGPEIIISRTDNHFLYKLFDK